MFIVLVIGCFLIGGASVGYVASLVKDEPVRDKAEIIAKINQNTETSFAYFSDGTPIGQLRSDHDQQMAKFSEIPQSLKDGVIAVEDEDFYEHYGVDVSGFLRAVKEKLLNEQQQTGGSTITQQLVKNVFFTLKPTMERKARELFLAVRVERYISKDAILLAYLNKSPFGSGAISNNIYGIKAAAKGIFGIDDLHDLNIAQSAYLAGLPQSPASYSAFDGYGNFNEDGFNRAIKRQHIVLGQMLDTGKITKEDYEEALSFDIKSSLAQEKQRAYNDYPFLMIEIERRAADVLALKENPELTRADLEKEEYSELAADSQQKLMTEGYHIYTTIDKELYDRFQEIAQNEENFLPYDEDRGHEQIGAIMLDNETSAILAMIEGRDYYIEQLNHATQMERQPGSTMKPIAAYLPALESGDIQPASIIDDIPILLEDGSKDVPHMPNNWNNDFHGLMTARYALDRSYNIPALKLFNEVVGIEDSWNFTKKLGITTIQESDYLARTGVIGGLSVGTRLDEMTNAYSTIANQGKYKDTYMISRVDTSDKETVYEHNVIPTKVFSEQTAYLMTDMLRTVISNSHGTGKLIRSQFNNYSNVPVVGKTGSTQNDRDAWFIGYSPDITVGVWAGHDNNKPMITGSSLPQGPSTQRAMRIWSMLMDSSVELHPELFETESFAQPDNITQMTVSSVSGKLPSELVRETGKLNTDYFNTKWVPTEVDSSLVKMKVIRHNGKNYIPQSTTPQDMVNEEILIQREEPIYELMDQIEEILKKIPMDQRPFDDGSRMTLEDYYPEDFAQTAPVEVDPRSYDKQQSELAPLQPPIGLSLEKHEGKNVITFAESDNPNVVGYRFYRAYEGKDFQPRPKQNVRVDQFEGEALSIIDWVIEQYDYAYYITAVDILGRESKPSEIMYDIKSENPPSNWVDGGDESDTNDDEDSEQNRDDENDENEGPVPGIPKNVQVEMQDNGLSILVTWDPDPISDRVLYYVVYYKKEQTDEYTVIGDNVYSTKFKYITFASEGWYRVSGVNKNGSSELSAPVKINHSNNVEE